MYENFAQRAHPFLRYIFLANQIYKLIRNGIVSHKWGIEYLGLKIPDYIPESATILEHLISHPISKYLQSGDTVRAIDAITSTGNFIADVITDSVSWTSLIGLTVPLATDFSGYAVDQELQYIGKNIDDALEGLRNETNSSSCAEYQSQLDTARLFLNNKEELKGAYLHPENTFRPFVGISVVATKCYLEPFECVKVIHSFTTIEWTGLLKAAFMHGIIADKVFNNLESKTLELIAECTQKESSEGRCYIQEAPNHFPTYPLNNKQETETFAISAPSSTSGELINAPDEL